MMKMKHAALVLMCSAALLQGCSKTEEKTPEAKEQAPVSLNDATSVTKAKEVIEEKQVAAVPLADKSVPLSNYKEMDSGRTMMFAFIAVDTLPLDYEKVAALVSRDYSGEDDDFKKRDLLQALKPGIDAEVEKAKANKYYYMTITDQLGKYNFDTKSFGHTAFGDASSYRYFNDIRRYNLQFTNSDQYSQIEVPDETRARQIEGLRSKYQGLITKVYFFASSTELGSTNLKGEITKVQILDTKGTVLAEK